MGGERMMKCQHCPVRAGLDCFGEKHKPACELVRAGQPGRAEQLIAMAENPPGLLEMAGNFAKAVAGHVANGMKPTPPDVEESRKAICMACPFHDAESDRCVKCGCNLSIKRSWESSTCPENKWHERGQL